VSGTLTSYGRQQLLLGTFIPEDFVTPSGLWVAYTTSVPVANSDGSQLDEDSGLGRAPIGALSGDNWAFTGFAEIYNTNIIAFPTATADTELILGYAIVDDADPGEGNCWAVGPVIEPFQVVTGEEPTIDVAGLAIGLYD